MIKSVGLKELSFAIMVFMVGAFLQGCNRPAPQLSASPPDGWQVWHNASPANDYVEQCVSRSRTAFSVTLENTKIVISRVSPLALAVSEELPFKVKAHPGMQGSRRVLKTSNGWLVGFDNGEFGGGLWWFSADGKQSTRLLDENITGFLRTDSHTFVFSGLDHMGSYGGQVYDSQAPQAVKKIADFPAKPSAFTTDLSGKVIVAGAKGVYRLGSTNTVEPIFEKNLYAYSPNSLAVAQDGSIYVGMQFFVLRLLSHDGRYQEEWLVPVGCTGIKVTDDDCTCGTPSEKPRATLFAPDLGLDLQGLHL